MIGLGVDIVAISRMRETLERSGSAFINRVFTKKEQDNSRSHQDAAVYFAEVFAAKEAVFKTFSMSWKHNMSFLDIEVEKGLSGEPLVLLHGEFRDLLARKDGKGILISLSWELDAAVAVAAMC
jgi:holo-[acyl-carrier protein] synthase